MSNVTLISVPKVNTAVREIQQLGVSPPDKAIRKIIEGLYHDAYTNGLRAARLDKVTPEEAYPFRRTNEPQHRQFDLKPSGET